MYASRGIDRESPIRTLDGCLLQVGCRKRGDQIEKGEVFVNLSGECYSQL